MLVSKDKASKDCVSFDELERYPSKVEDGPRRIWHPSRYVCIFRKLDGRQMIYRPVSLILRPCNLCLV
ncbi:hypothetical protein HanRHA438_Chr01g0004991 [Helianthus annuus]|nr:hypothetical protein HanRHA438_Chr01g0004991 [Helianthus annuus]